MYVCMYGKAADTVRHRLHLHLLALGQPVKGDGAALERAQVDEHDGARCAEKSKHYRQGAMWPALVTRRARTQSSVPA